MFAKMLKNFFWNSWDNISRLLGFSVFGAMINVPLILGIVLLWGTAKLTPDQLQRNAVPSKQQVEKFMTGKDKKAKKIVIKKKAATKNTKLSAVKKTTPNTDTTTKSINKDKPKSKFDSLTPNEAYHIFSNIVFAILLSFSFPTMGAVFGGLRDAFQGTQDSFFRSLGRNFKKYFLRTSGLFLFNLFIYFIFLNAFKFYLFFGPLQKMAILKYIAMGISSWLFLFYTMIQLYMLPLIIDRKESFIISLKRSALLVIDNIVQSFTVLVITIMIFALSNFSLVISTIVLMGTIASLHLTNFYVLLKKYEPDDKKNNNTEFIKDFSAEEETRSWRTLFKPWES